jgi:hypothetical protein
MASFLVGQGAAPGQAVRALADRTPMIGFLNDPIPVAALLATISAGAGGDRKPASSDIVGHSGDCRRGHEKTPPSPAGFLRHG